MLSYFKIFRLTNLLIIALSMYLVRIFIIQPILFFGGNTLALNNVDFFLLVLSVVMIAAAGFVINDYFDIRVDRINKPDKVIVGKKISRRKVMLLHQVLSFAGFLVGGYVAWKAGNLWLILIFIFTILLLWFYTTKFQRNYLSGNIIIAFLSAFVIYLPWLFEFFALKSTLISPVKFSNIINRFVLSICLFAFLISLVREIIKDNEDIEGDQKAGYHTLAIASGMKTSKNIIISINLVLISLIIYFEVIFLSLNYSLFNVIWGVIYLIIAVQFLLIFHIYKTYKAADKKDFSRLSNLSKIIMLTGILSIPVIFYYFCNH